MANGDPNKLKGAFTLNSPFRPKALSSVCFRWCESINRTRVRTKSSGPRPPKRGGLGFWQNPKFVSKLRVYACFFYWTSLYADYHKTEK